MTLKPSTARALAALALAGRPRTAGDTTSRLPTLAELDTEVAARTARLGGETRSENALAGSVPVQAAAADDFVSTLNASLPRHAIIPGRS